LFRQQITTFFWEKEKHRCNLYVSNYVIEECSKGDPEYVKKRLQLIEGIPVLNKPKDIDKLALEYYKLLNIPTSAKTDSYHLAICVAHNIDFLLSWNLKHCGQRSFLLMVEYNVKRGLHTPILCNPSELLLDMESWTKTN
jgi:hypothetical protein